MKYFASFHVISVFRTTSELDINTTPPQIIESFVNEIFDDIITFTIEVKQQMEMHVSNKYQLQAEKKGLKAKIIATLLSVYPMQETETPKSRIN